MSRSPKVFLFLLLLSVIWACAGKEEVSQSGNLDEFRTYPIDINATAKRFSRQMEAVEVTYLEETEDSFLDYPYRMSFYKDNLVFPSGRKGDVYVYSDQGKYLSRFNHQGDGPGEYSDYNGIWMSADTVIIFNHGKQSLLYYDMEGQHLKTRKLAQMAAHITSLQGQLLYDMTMELVDDSLQYRLLIEDGAGQRQGLYLPYKNRLPFSVYSNVSTFKPYGENLTFQPAYQDTVYQVKPDGVTPLFAFDFEGGYYWTDEIFEKGPAALNLIVDSGKVWLYQAFVGPDQIFLTYSTSFQDSFVGLIDRATGEFTQLQKRLKGEEEYRLAIIRKAGDRFLFSMPPDQVKTFLEELDPGQVQFSEGSSLEKIEASENPTLLWVKFKKN